MITHSAVGWSDRAPTYLDIQVGTPYEDSFMSMDEFTETELELIAAFIFNTKLGKNIAPHRDAAYTLLDKLLDFFGEKELERRVEQINMKAEFYDQNRNLLIAADVNDIEFDIRP